MKTLTVVFAAFTLFAPLPAGATQPHDYIGDDIKDVPLFDAHIHYNERAWGAYPPDAVLGLMDGTGVAMALVSSTPDEGTVKLLRFAPGRIVPELRPYYANVDSTNWTRAPGMYEYLTERLAAHPHEGIGEFHLHEVNPEDEALLKQIAAIAVKQGLFIHVHSDKAPVDLLYSLQPSLRVIWAHAGMVESAAVVESMMARYSTLYADTSYRESDILNAAGTIDPDWRRVIERFPDRFMVGSDTWSNNQWDDYQSLIETNRQWLSQFSRSVAESIAFKNAERLFGRKLGKDLIGTR